MTRILWTCVLAQNGETFWSKISYWNFKHSWTRVLFRKFYAYSIAAIISRFYLFVHHFMYRSNFICNHIRLICFLFYEWLRNKKFAKGHFQLRTAVQQLTRSTPIALLPLFSKPFLVVHHSRSSSKTWAWSDWSFCVAWWLSRCCRSEGFLQLWKDISDLARQNLVWGFYVATKQATLREYGI